MLLKNKWLCLCLSVFSLFSQNVLKAENDDVKPENVLEKTEANISSEDENAVQKNPSESIAADEPEAIENEENASETAELKPTEPPIFTEPFTESDLSFLEPNLENLNKNYTYNYHTTQLKLAFLTLNKKFDKTHKKYEYKKIIGPLVAPYKITACTGIFPEFNKIAEKLRIKIISKAEERIVKGDSEKAIACAKEAFKIINDIQECFYSTVTNNEQCIKNIEKNYLNYENWNITTKADDALELLHEQSKDLKNVYEAYKTHAEYCNIYLEYAANEKNRIKQALGFSSIKKNTEDFVSYYDYYRDQFEELSNTSKALQPTLYIERETLIKKATISRNKEIEVKNAINKFPDFLKSPAPDLSGLIGKDSLIKIFDLLNKLCDSPLLKDELQMDETIEKQRQQRIARSEKLLEKFIPYLDPNNTELTPDYGELFKKKDEN